MSEKSRNLTLKYAVISFFGCLIGGAVGGRARQRKGKQ